MGSHPILWHPLDCLTSSLSQNYATQMMAILFQAWYLDDGALAGKKSSALTLIQEIGPMLDLHVDIEKCELSDKIALRIKN